MMRRFRLPLLTLRLQRSFLSTRSFLPESYACNHQWDSYLQSQMNECKINQAKASEILVAAKDHATKGGKFYEIDIDSISLGIGKGLYDETELNYFEQNILPAFRRGPRSCHWLDSTPATLTKSYIEYNYIQRLKNLVGNKQEYGIFPDHISYCQLLDYLLAKGDNEGAAFFATEWMLQEDQSKSLTANYLSLLACWRRALELEKEDLDLSVPGEDNEEEEVVRVNFLINPHNDLHFDLKSEHHRIGKTLITFGRLYNNEHCMLLGNALLEQFNDSLVLINTSNDKISIEALEKYEKLLEVVETREDAESRWKSIMDDHIDKILIQRKISKDEKNKLMEEFKTVRQNLESSGRVNNEAGLVDESLSSLVRVAVGKESSQDISVRQTQLQETWVETRRNLVDQQVFEAGRLEAIASCRLRLADIKERMERLMFFEQRDELGVRQAMGEDASRQKEAKKEAKVKARHDQRWKKPIVKLEEARANIGIYPITGV